MLWPREAEAPWLATAQAAQTRALGLAGGGEGLAEEAVAAEMAKTVTLWQLRLAVSSCHQTAN